MGLFKALKKIAKPLAIGAAVGAITVATGGLGAGIGAGAFLSVGGTIAAASGVGFAVTATSLAVVGAIGGAAIFGGLSALKQAQKAFTKKPSMDLGPVVERLRAEIDPDAPGHFAIGKTAAAAKIVYVEKIGDSKVLMIYEAASHEIQAYDELWIDGELAITSAGTVVAGWEGIVTRYTNTGTEGQSALSVPGSSWPATARGRGIAHYGLLYDLKEGQDKLAGGIPTNIRQIVLGAKTYDPRLDSTVGGSGTHRADNAATWTYDANCNWARHALSYILGYRTNGKLVFGKGDDPEDIDYDQWIAMANVCDEPQDGLTRYQIGGLLQTLNDHDYVLTQFESAIGATIDRVAGKWFCWVPHDDLVSVGTITDDDLISIDFDPGGDVANLKNTGRGLYPEPSLLYQLADYPEVVEATAVTEDGGERAVEHNFSLIQSPSIAERVIRQMVRRTRFPGSWQAVMGPKALLVRPFDIITMNNRETNYIDELARINSMRYALIGGEVALVATEEHASIYDTTLPLGTPVTQLDPGTYDPRAKIPPGVPTVADTAIAGDSGTSKNFLKVTWPDPGGFCDHTEVQYRVKAGPGPIQTVPASRVDFLEATCGPVEQTTVYQARIRHVSIFGVPGDWSAWVDETSGAGEIVGTASSVPWEGITGVPYAQVISNADDVVLGFNPAFAAWSGTYPDGWANWSGAAPAKETVLVRAGQYAARWSVAGANTGMQRQQMFASSPLPAGTFLGGTVDILMAARTSGLPGIVIDLITNSAGTSYVRTAVQPQGTATGIWYRIPWIARANGLAVYGIRIYAMASWTGFASGAFTGQVVIDNIRFALFDPSTDNTTVKIGANGTLSGAGGGQVTITGLGYSGHLQATRNTGALADKNQANWNTDIINKPTIPGGDLAFLDQVNTSQIIPKATAELAASYTSGAASFFSGAASIQGISIPAARNNGGKCMVLYTGTFTYSNSSTIYPRFSIRRYVSGAFNATVGTWSFVRARNNASDPTASVCGAIDDPPAGVDLSYYVFVEAASGDNGAASGRFLSVFQSKNDTA